MYPAEFDYYRANTLQEAISLLREHGDAKLLAGGHSLIPAMKLRLAQPPALIDIGRIESLKGISQNDNTLRIGALTTYASVAASDLLRQKCAVLTEAASQIGDQQVRNKGTVGGNLAHADPASDLPGVALALDAVLHVAGPNGERQIQAADFFVDLLMTALAPDEILTAIDVPVLGADSGSTYLKFENPASGYAICGAAAVVRLAGDGTCHSAHLCFNGVTATPFRAVAVTDALVGKSLEDATIDAAIEDQLSITDPMTDIHASGPYRIGLAKVYGKRALQAARDRAKG